MGYSYTCDVTDLASSSSSSEEEVQQDRTPAPASAPKPRRRTGKPTAVNLFRLGNILSSTADTIAFCQKHRLLPTSASCRICRTTLHRTYTVKRLGRQRHEVRFQCNKKQCKSRLNQVSIKKGTWFADSRISLRKSLLLVYCFVQKLNYEHTIRETSVSSAEESDGSSTETR